MAITQDNLGFYWIGTQQGLNRYDGYKFRQFFHDSDDPNSLPGDWIWALHTDRNGDIWVGAASGGVARYDRTTQAFQRYALAPAVRAIAEDGKGFLYLGTDGAGVVRLDPASGMQVSYSVGNERVKALHVGSEGTVWAGTDGSGLYKLEPGAQDFVMVDSIADGERVRNVVGDDKTLWVGTYENGLFQLDRATQAVERHSHTPEGAGGLPSNSYRALLLCADETLWVGNEAAGLTRFDGASFTNFQHDGGNQRSLIGDHVSALYEDRDGLLWIGTHTGLSVLNPIASTFVNFSGASSNWISSFAEDDASGVWVASMGGGINRYDLTTGSSDRVPGPLSSDRITTLMIQASNDQVWAGTRAEGVNRYDPVSGQWHAYRHDPDDPGSLSFNGVTSLLEDAAGGVWVGTYLGGLNRYEPATDNFTHFRHDPGDVSSLCADRVLSIYQEAARVFWLGTHGGGLCRFDPVDETFLSIRHDPDRPESLASDDAWIVVEDRDANLWIGTSDAGVNVWLAADRAAGREQFLNFDTSDGLATSVVYGMQVDNDGAVWISGSRGITRIVLDTETMSLRDVRRFSEEDGLPGSEYNFAASLRLRSGHLLFGGTAGFTAFDPGEIRPDRSISDLVLTSITKMNREFPIPNRNEDLVLSHEDRMVTLEFSTMNFGARQTSQYMHMLEGFDSGWIEDGNRHRVSYTNLDPGEYLFKVRASNADGAAGSAEIALPIRVLAAPWASTTAYMAYAIVALMLVVSGWKSWQNRMAKTTELNKAHAALLFEVEEREAKERQLASEQRRAQQYLDIVEVIILALDDQDRVSLVNQKGARVFGRDESEIVGLHFFKDLVPPDQALNAKKLLDEASQYTYCEFHIRDQAGDDRLVAWHVARITGGLLMSGTDVTQMRVLEHELHKSQKLEALGTLSRGVAHDFNNILSAILGYAELSRSELAADSPARAYQEKIGASVERAREIIKGILTFGQVTRGSRKPTDLSVTVGEALQLVHPVLPPNISLIEALDDGGELVLADPAQIIQVVLNLCTNAIQSMGEAPGNVTVSTELLDLDIETSRSLLLAHPGRYLLISVADTGPGMDEQVQARVFEPYFTTRAPGEGSGLGLSVVHGIVTQLDGAVRLQSAIGEGSRFDIYLPRYEGDIKPRQALDDAETENVAGEGTVLLVDDEEDILSTLTGLLESAGFTVVCVSSGEEAIEKIVSTEYDLLITDQTMRGIRGQDVAARARSEHPDLPIILMSGAVQPSCEHVDHFIGKPFTRAQLLSVVNTLLSRDVSESSV